MDDSRRPGLLGPAARTIVDSAWDSGAQANPRALPSKMERRVSGPVQGVAGRTRPTVPPVHAHRGAPRGDAAIEQRLCHLGCSDPPARGQPRPALAGGDGFTAGCQHGQVPWVDTGGPCGSTTPLAGRSATDGGGVGAVESTPVIGSGADAGAGCPRPARRGLRPGLPPGRPWAGRSAWAPPARNAAEVFSDPVQRWTNHRALWWCTFASRPPGPRGRCCERLRDRSRSCLARCRCRLRVHPACLHPR